MTITLSVEEFDKFASDLQRWYSNGLEYIVQNAQINRMTERYDEALIAAFEQFKQTNPQPRWRNYLK